MRRRQVLTMAGAAPLAGLGLPGCSPAPEASKRDALNRVPVRWVGANAERGHQLRDGFGQGKSGSLPPVAVRRQTGVLVVGGGVAGLSALHHLPKAGVDDAVLLELEDQVGGNSRGHSVGGLACPLGAHYLPVPGPAAIEVGAWLHDIGLLRSTAAGVVPNERYLCHAPQERLFIDGAWQDGLLPAADGRPATQAQYRLFARLVDGAQRRLGFNLPTHAGRFTADHAALDAQTFGAWLQAQGVSDPHLLGYLDYACRDDYGAGIQTVSAWAGLHYFASRHGFHPPGDDSAERDAVFTWPEGNAFLVRELATPLQPRMQPGRTVVRVTAERQGVQVLAFDHAARQLEAWRANTVVLATPLFITQRLLHGAEAALQQALAEAAAATRYAPWLVGNLLLRGPLQERVGAPAAWDNVAFAPAGGHAALGYVNARHQSLRPDAGLTGPQLLTTYHALPVAERASLLQQPAASWLARIVADLQAVHPDLPEQLQQAELMRWGHAMSIPVPGVRSQAARTALRQARGRIRFAHADLAGYSVFEEAFTLGAESTRQIR